jgi:hypothetical protein
MTTNATTLENVGEMNNLDIEDMNQLLVKVKHIFIITVTEHHPLSEQIAHNPTPTYGYTSHPLLNYSNCIQDFVEQPPFKVTWSSGVEVMEATDNKR